MNSQLIITWPGLSFNEMTMFPVISTQLHSHIQKKIRGNYLGSYLFNSWLHPYGAKKVHIGSLNVAFWGEKMQCAFHKILMVHG